MAFGRALGNRQLLNANKAVNVTSNYFMMLCIYLLMIGIVYLGKVSLFF